jgi:hypothetical protein
VVARGTWHAPSLPTSQRLRNDRTEHDSVVSTPALPVQRVRVIFGALLLVLLLGARGPTKL